MIDGGEIWFNELSIIVQEDVFQANLLIVQFVNALAAARTAGFKNRLRLAHDLFSIAIAPNYNIAKWVNQTTDRNRRALLIGWQTNWPHLRMDEAEHTAKALGYQFLINNSEALGAGLAWLFDGLPVSFDIGPFSRPTLEITVKRLLDDASIEESLENVPHVSRPGHVAEAFTKIHANRVAALSDGAQIWQSRNDLLFNLAFCNGVGETIESLGQNDPHFIAVRKMLIALNDLASEWHEGEIPIDKFAHKITVESGATLKRYGTERTFIGPDGISRKFSLHGRLTPNAWRYYICETKVEDKLLVGYIGPKLSTVKDPT